MSSNNKRKPIEDFDDILDYVGGWGPFQYYSTLVFFQDITLFLLKAIVISVDKCYIYIDIFLL